MPITEEEYSNDLLFLSLEQEQPWDLLEIEECRVCATCGLRFFGLVGATYNLIWGFTIVYPLTCPRCGRDCSIDSSVSRLKPYSTRHNE